MSKRRGRYVSVFGDWYRHPKVAGDRHPESGKDYERLSLAARGLWVSLLSRSGDGRLDGEASLKSSQSAAPGVPDKVLKKLLAELEANDLVKDGKLVNYSECNLTRSEDEANKEVDKVRKREERKPDSRPKSAPRPAPVQPDTGGTTAGPSDSGLRTQDSGPLGEGGSPAALGPKSSTRTWSALADTMRKAIEAGARAAQMPSPIECSEPDHRAWTECARQALELAEAKGVDARDVMRLAAEEAVLDMPRRAWKVRHLAEDFVALVSADHIERRAKARGGVAA